MLKIAILDDYAGAALSCADWDQLRPIAEITVFTHHLCEAEAIHALQPFDILCTMRERMALPRRLIQQLPNLKLITIAGQAVANLDMAAATDHGVLVIGSDPHNPILAQAQAATPELTWGLMIATVRHLAEETQRLRQGGWQATTGITLAGKTLGLLGLGRIGKRIAAYAQVFGMKTIAWSQNLTAEAAASVGVTRVEKDQLFAGSDIVSVHLKLSDRTQGLVDARALALMKPGAYLINTSRGPIVEEAALIAALQSGRLAGAGLDVFDEEPLPADHPLRTLPGVTATPHLGYTTIETLRGFYADVPAAITAFAQGNPIRVLNSDALRVVRRVAFRVL